MVFHDFGVRNPLYQVRNEFDRLFNGVLSPAAEAFGFQSQLNQPAVNIWEKEEAVLVEMEVPGVKKEQLDLSVLGSELTIRINRPDQDEKEMVYHRRERPVGNFSRVLSLPCEVDADHVAAELHDGVLTITLPKAEAAKPRKITVAS
jgi:HSP20 family protein